MKNVAIIGGGPAGAMTAEALARGTVAQGYPAGDPLQVTVFEEKLGWEKPCGGGVTFKALQRYPWLMGEDCDPKLVREGEFVAANGKSIRLRLRQPVAIYSRAALNDSLLRRAERAGAKVVRDRILGVERNGEGWLLRGSRGSYCADFLVLAGGARSRLRGALAGEFGARDFMLTLGYYVPVRDDLLRIQFFEDFEGYAWSFPRSDHLSVGICAKVGECPMVELRERLEQFMEKFGYPRAGAQVYSHLLPSLSVESWGSLRLAGKGWAVVGDAAGLVDPLTGEGIYYAMRSGELLAESLLEASPESYAARVREEFGRDLALGARLAPFFYRSDFFGQAVTTRTIQIARRSATFAQLLEDLIEGSQGYMGLVARFCRGLAVTLAETAQSFIREAFSTPLSART